MRTRSTRTMLITTGRMGLLAGTLALCAFAHDTCGAETFKGAYGFTVTGYVLPPLSFGEFGFGGGEGVVPIQGVQLITSDGKGNLTDKESISVGGQPLAATPENPFSNHYGTYKIDTDCTGTAFLTNAKFICPDHPDSCQNANVVNVALVIDKEGNKIRMVAVPPYDSGGIQRVITSLGEKLEPSERHRDRDDGWR